MKLPRPIVLQTLLLVLSSSFAALSLSAQAPSQPTPQWQIDAGGQMSFDVASVKPDKTADPEFRTNFPLSLGPNFGSVGGVFSADVPLRTLIGFAYKLSVGQTKFLMPGLPSWVDSEYFDVEARAAGTPTKDQFRLMVQALLTDRFKMTTHHETRQLPILALVQAKPGKLGPQLIPHVDDAKCGAVGQPGAPEAPPDLAQLPCDAILIGIPSKIPGRMIGGGRSVNVDYITAALTGTGFQGLDSSRLVVNQTGLIGKYDFWIEIANGNRDQQADPNGPTMLEALQEQLGLKLESTTGLVDVLVIDHIEEPTQN